MKKHLLLIAVILTSSFSFGQTIVWGVGGFIGVADGEFQNSFNTNTLTSWTYDPNVWTAQTFSDGSGTPGNAYWTNTTIGYSQGINSDGIPLGSPSQANGVAIFDSDYLDNGGIVGNEGGGISPAVQRGDLVSPRMDLTGYTDSAIVLKMFLKYSADSINELSVSFSTDDGANWAVPRDLRISHSNNVEGYSSITFIEEFMGVVNLSQCRLKFRFDGDYNYAMVDDITLFSSYNYWGTSTIVSYSTIAAHSCSSTYTSPSGNYTWNSPGVYQDTLTNQYSNDSIMTIHLSFGTPSTSTDVQTACDSFTWMDGNTYMASNNTATYTLTNSTGCDSTIALDLTINTINSATTTSGLTITANESGATYQWIDCGNGNTPISGETNQSFTATANGDYAVIVTLNNCSDTSACESISTVGLGNVFEHQSISVAPNPSKSYFLIEGDLLKSTNSIQVISIEGKHVIEQSVNDESSFEIDAINWTPGVYFLNLNTEYGDRTFKLIKE